MIKSKVKKDGYYVVGYDSFSNETYPIRKDLTLEEAMALANSKGGTMNIVYVHDSNGDIVTRRGSY